MNELKELYTIDFLSVFLSVVIILSGWKIICGTLEWCCKTFGIEFKWMRQKQEEHRLLINTSNRMELLEKQHKIDMEHSISHNNEIKNNLINLAAIVDSINHKLDSMENKNDANERAQLKDRIAQAYRKYSETKEWTCMEEEAFRDLIADYELHGGKNSFVHSVCEPESYSWKISDR